MQVPSAIPAGSIFPLLPLSITICWPLVPAGRLEIVSLLTIPMLASASPLNPKVPIDARSS